MTVSLRAMTDDDFTSFVSRSVEYYAEDQVQATSLPIEQARVESAKQLSEMLPDGRHTSGHSFWMVLDDEREVGVLWLGPHPRREATAYIYDITMHEGERGKGFGRAALAAADELSRDAGFTAIGLNVFGFNDGAKRLYSSVGYEVVSTNMLKQL